MSKYIKSFSPDPYSSGGNDKKKWFEKYLDAIVILIVIGLCYLVFDWIVNS